MLTVNLKVAALTSPKRVMESSPCVVRISTLIHFKPIAAPLVNSVNPTRTMTLPNQVLIKTTLMSKVLNSLSKKVENGGACVNQYDNCEGMKFLCNDSSNEYSGR